MIRNRRSLLSVILVATVLLSGCAAAFNSRGLNLAAEANFSQIVREFEPAQDRFSGLAFQDLIYLCSAYSELKNYRKLFPCLESAQAKVNAGDFTADAWNHSATPSRLKAIALIELGQYEEAVRAAEAADKFVTDKGLTTFEQVKVLEVLGLAYALAGKTDKAGVVVQRLKDVYLGYPYMLVKDDRNIALAKIYITLKKYQEAIEVVSYKFEDSNAFLKSIGGWDVFVNNKLTFEFMKNKSLFEVGRLADAKTGYDALLAYPYMADRGEMYWVILYDRGRIAEKEGRRAEAIRFYEKAVEVIEQQRATISVEAGKIGFVGDKQAVYARLITLLVEDGQQAKAFEYVERSKSRALVDLLAGKKDFAVKETAREEQVRQALAANDRSEADLLALDKNADKSRTRGIALRAKQDLQKEAPELASLVTVASTSAADIRSALGQDEALVEYYYTDSELLAFVLSASGLQSAKLHLPGLAEDVAAFRRALENPRSGDAAALAGKLHRRLFKPLEPALAARQLVIVPHGALHYIPFNALYDGKRFLIDRYEIRLMPSASAMRYLKNAPKNGPGGILVLGNPDLGDPRSDLAFAQKEALEVAKIWPRSRVFLRKDATEDVVRRYGSDYQYIHFATHGRFSPDHPLASALLLAPDARSNGHLTVDKLYSLHLGAALVTLSACETGLGTVSSGDDLVGLTRGFLYAGAGSIVASLWQVDDLATSYLMIRFYRELQKKDKLSALRNAQLETRRKYPHPYYWASFQLTGNAR
ncbi:MAG: CHAT domain-containing protein [Deltaproteobacteria bacterium]|nr:CHAT domain-containing protein [Syntrophaceae bacterium]NLX50529.1 CHAT domain-containing protein [Deltaproteobacteria bacterium]